ncbi:hypothetical protein [Nostocoides sp. HKS02]|uniref:hypothetical protein n=1 Tax=Nostocoides sp. HKS02 TaxID=1813880 RepID=UPI0018A7F93C|nr:hypothetical protein [Tetrasphaera sp. HKS02]
MRKVLGLAIATVAAFWMVAPAHAAPAASLRVSPATQQAGGSVQVNGTCEANTSGFAISPAFLHDSAHDFAGVGAVAFTTDSTGAFTATATIPASRTPGSYTVSARCGGGNLGVTATLVVTSASSLPTRVPAGTGGLAATGSGWSAPQLGLAAVGGLLVLLGGFGIARQRTRR